jgi:hypothetical protein
MLRWIVLARYNVRYTPVAIATRTSLARWGEAVTLTRVMLTVAKEDGLSQVQAVIAMEVLLAIGKGYPAVDNGDAPYIG